MVVREGGIVNLFASSLFLGTDLKLWMNIFKEGGRFLTRECDSDIIVSRWVWMNLSKSVTKQTNRKSCIGINFCQLSHKSQEIGHYYRSPCGLQLIGNYRHLNMFLQSSSTFACLIHISTSFPKWFFPVFIYIYQNKYEQVYNVSVCRGTTYAIFLFWMYTIKIHNVHNQNTSSESYSMHVVRITEVGVVFANNTLTTFLAKCWQDWKMWKNRVEPWSSYPSRAQP